MFGLSLVHWALLLGVAILLLGGARLSGIMGDFGRGIRAFQKGMSEPDDKAGS